MLHTVSMQRAEILFALSLGRVVRGFFPFLYLANVSQSRAHAVGLFRLLEVFLQVTPLCTFSHGLQQLQHLAEGGPLMRVRMHALLGQILQDNRLWSEHDSD